MDFYKSSLYIYKFDFPMRKKYLSTIGNYAKKLNKGFSFINDEFSKLLKKNKVEEIEEEKKKKYLLMLKLLQEKKQKKVQSEINRQKRIELNKKMTKSVSNNKMLLDIMSKSKQFIKYLNHQKQSRNNDMEISKNSSVSKNNKSILKSQKSGLYTFMTELPRNNISFNKDKKTKNIIIKSMRQKVPKFNYNSYLTLKKIKEKILNKKNMTMRKKNFSVNDLLGPRTHKIPKFKKPNINLNLFISNDNKIRPFYIK